MEEIKPEIKKFIKEYIENSKEQKEIVKIFKSIEKKIFNHSCKDFSNEEKKLMKHLKKYCSNPREKVLDLDEVGDPDLQGDILDIKILFQSIDFRYKYYIHMKPGSNYYLENEKLVSSIIVSQKLLITLGKKIRILLDIANFSKIPLEEIWT